MVVVQTESTPVMPSNLRPVTAASLLRQNLFQDRFVVIAQVRCSPVFPVPLLDSTISTASLITVATAGRRHLPRRNLVNSDYTISRLQPLLLPPHASVYRRHWVRRGGSLTSTYEIGRRKKEGVGDSSSLPARLVAAHHSRYRESCLMSFLSVLES